MKLKSRYDVVAVNLETSRVRFIALDKPLANAERIVERAIERNGVDEEFYAEVPAGVYEAGDEWQGYNPRPLCSDS